MSIHRAIASLKAAIASLDIATGAFDDEHLNEALTAAQLQIGNAATMIFAVQADGDGATLDEIGAAQNISRERVRQIEFKAIAHLRAEREMRRLA